MATPQQVQADALRIAQDRKVEFKVETWHFQKVTVSQLLWLYKLIFCGLYLLLLYKLLYNNASRRANKG